MYNWLLSQRAQRLARFLAPHLDRNDLARTVQVIDIGSGTGHNAGALRQRNNLHVTEVDVADLHSIGPGPRLFNGRWLPFSDDAFDAALLLFVIHYAEFPDELLRESLRVSRRVLVLQSTCQGLLGRSLLRLRELLTGWGAFQIAWVAGYVRGSGDSLRARMLYSPAGLAERFGEVNALVVSVVPFDTLFGVLSRNLYILEARRSD